MANKLRIQQLLKIYRRAKRVYSPHELCLVFPKGRGGLRVMIAFEKYLMAQETYVYARKTAEKLRAKLLISES